jgi:hypothetical protein
VSWLSNYVQEILIEHAKIAGSELMLRINLNGFYRKCSGGRMAWCNGMAGPEHFG